VWAIRVTPPENRSTYRLPRTVGVGMPRFSTSSSPASEGVAVSLMRVAGVNACPTTRRRTRVTRDEVIAALVNERFGAPPEKSPPVKHRVKPTDKADTGLTCENTTDQEGGGLTPMLGQQ
jgi:hypothetical protein